MGSGVLRLILVGIFFIVEHAYEARFVLLIDNPHSHDAKIPALNNPLALLVGMLLDQQVRSPRSPIFSDGSSSSSRSRPGSADPLL